MVAPRHDLFTRLCLGEICVLYVCVCCVVFEEIIDLLLYFTLFVVVVVSQIVSAFYFVFLPSYSSSSSFSPTQKFKPLHPTYSVVLLWWVHSLLSIVHCILDRYSKCYTRERFSSTVIEHIILIPSNASHRRRTGDPSCSCCCVPYHSTTRRLIRLCRRRTVPVS